MVCWTEADQATPFIHAASQASGLRIAYIVTDDDRRFQAIAKRLPDGVEPVRLYESYLQFQLRERGIKMKFTPADLST